MFDNNNMKMNKKIIVMAGSMLALGIKADVDCKTCSGLDRYDQFVKYLLVNSTESTATLKSTADTADDWNVNPIFVQSSGGAAGSISKMVSEAQAYGLKVAAGAFIGSNCANTDSDNLSSR